MMSSLLRTPIRAGYHLAIWLIWQSTGRSHLADMVEQPVGRAHAGDSAGRAA